MKKRKVTILLPHERCLAIINNGNQCSRRRKYNQFCGKHNKKQQYGIISNNILLNLINPNLIEVTKITIEQQDYLIDKNHIIFTSDKTKIIGKIKNNKIIRL